MTWATARSPFPFIKSLVIYAVTEFPLVQKPAPARLRPFACRPQQDVKDGCIEAMPDEMRAERKDRANGNVDRAEKEGNQKHPGCNPEPPGGRRLRRMRDLCLL